MQARNLIYFQKAMDSEGIIVAKKYRLLECIGEGSFGEIFYGSLLAKVSARSGLDERTGSEAGVEREQTLSA